MKEQACKTSETWAKFGEEQIAANPGRELQIRAMMADPTDPICLEAWRERNVDKPVSLVAIGATSLGDGNDKFTHDIGLAFARRGDAYFGAGKFVEALHDYSCAILQNYLPMSRHYERYPDVAAKRGEALFALRSFFSSEDTTAADAHLKGLPTPVIPAGYLVIGDGNVLFRSQLDNEGRRQAIQYAESLAHDSAERVRLDSLYLVDGDEFPVEVFEHDGTRPKLVYRVEPVEDDAEGR